jgi:large subunit ribosomal protein L17
MLSNMATSLIIHKRITTTTAKAKALKSFVEPLITKSKEDSTHSRRVVFSYLKDKEAVSELFREISPKVGERPGGYTRILKIGNRIGDNAEMCILELVDYNEAMLGGGQGTKGKTTTTTRRRRAPKKKAETTGVEKEVKTFKAKAEKQVEEPENESEETVAEEEK